MSTSTSSDAPVLFISYSAKDKPTAEAMCATLERRAIRCWIAPRDIIPGREWGEAIIDGISQCRIMVLVFSGHSNESAQVRREVERAVSKGLIIIPFRIEDVPMAKPLEYFLSSSHWLDALTPPLDPHIDKLATTIQSLLGDRSEPGASFGSAAEPRMAPRQPRKESRRRLAMAGVACGAILLLGAIALWSLLFDGRPPEGAPTKELERSALQDHQPGNPPAPTLPPSEAALRGGTLHVRSLSFRAHPPELVSKPGEKSESPRWVIVSNQVETEKWRSQDSRARLGFQITNNSHEGATLAKVELILLGVVAAFEDAIDEPRPPQVLQQLKPREVDASNPQTLFIAAGNTLFDDAKNDPPTALKLEVTSDHPEVAAARLDPESRIQVSVSGKQSGVANITVKATNAFDLTAQLSFPLTVRDKSAVAKASPRAPASSPAPSRDQRTTNQMPRVPSEGIEKFEMEKETLYLTNVQFAHSFKHSEFLRPCSSGNLLPENVNTFLKPNVGRKLSVDLACPTVWNIPADLPKDLLSGTRGRRLGARPPELLQTCHLLVLKVEVIGEDGKRHELYADRIHALDSWSKIKPVVEDGKPVVTSRLFGGEAKDLDAVLFSLLQWSVRTNGQTVSYQRAKRCGGVPEPFDTFAISPTCYYGDRASVFRRPDSPPPWSVPAETWPRTNLVQVLHQARLAHPRLVEQLDDALAKLATDAKADVARRAAYVAEQLRSVPATTTEPIESKQPHPAVLARD
jgi:hypothetical protein